jgi:predicted AlkP superfamily pyrophosphatase or phosphodiesterase
MSLTRRSFPVAALALSALLSAPVLAAQAPAAAPRPRLVVMLTVDQLRPDYLTVWRGQFTGGYERLLDEGAFFVNGYQDHANTETAPGHAAILSGRYPVRTGISANALGVETDAIPLVDVPGQGAGPFRFKGSTLADWMQAADPRTRVLSVARKDRGAILPVASSPKHSVFWYAPQAGRFTTSVHYGDTLPTWVRRFNDERGVFALAGRTWDRLLPDSAYAGDQSAPGLPSFPHVLPSDSMRLASMQSTFPWMDSLTLALALRGVEAMQLGAADDRTDLLAVSLSNTDGIGHRYGPDAPELHDHVLRVDRWLGTFLDSLITLRGRDGIILALTADHGATPTPDLRSRWGDNTGAIRIPSADLRRAFTTARAQLRTLGIDTLALSWSDLHLFLDRRRVAGREAELRPVVDAFLSAQRAVPGVLRADRFEDFLAADTTQDAYARRYLRMFVPGQEAPNGLVPLAVVTPRDLTVVGSGDAGRHGSPADADARVPIAFWGPGFVPGLRTTKAAVVDIAPTLADRLGVKPLESLDGRVLHEARR